MWTDVPCRVMLLLQSCACSVFFWTLSATACCPTQQQAPSTRPLEAASLPV